MSAAAEAKEAAPGDVEATTSAMPPVAAHAKRFAATKQQWLSEELILLAAETE